MLPIQRMSQTEWPEVARLIHQSTNHWYLQNRGAPIFSCSHEELQIFCEIYESLDPGCCLIVREAPAGPILASCFYRLRPQHVSLGILNVHPQAMGRRLGRLLVEEVIRIAEGENKPLRLVSSGLNLDSYSLYSRLGFVPREIFQDLSLTIPAGGMIELDNDYRPQPAIREARSDDLTAMAELEQRVAGITRMVDYHCFLENPFGIWHASVFIEQGRLRGWAISSNHPASRMLGPVVAENEEIGLALLQAEVDFRRGGDYVFLIPARSQRMLQQAYAWGAKNCELHFLQVRGESQEILGIAMPTFLPESF